MEACSPTTNRDLMAMPQLLLALNKKKYSRLAFSRLFSRSVLVRLRSFLCFKKVTCVDLLREDRDREIAYGNVNCWYVTVHNLPVCAGGKGKCHLS